MGDQPQASTKCPGFSPFHFLTLCILAGVYKKEKSELFNQAEQRRWKKSEGLPRNEHIKSPMCQRADPRPVRSPGKIIYEQGVDEKADQDQLTGYSALVDQHP